MAVFSCLLVQIRHTD